VPNYAKLLAMSRLLRQQYVHVTAIITYSFECYKTGARCLLRSGPALSIVSLYNISNPEDNLPISMFVLAKGMESKDLNSERSRRLFWKSHIPWQVNIPVSKKRLDLVSDLEHKPLAGAGDTKGCILYLREHRRYAAQLKRD
jgi:hypothetical protein